MCCILGWCLELCLKLYECITGKKVQMEKDASKEYFEPGQSYKFIGGDDKLGYCSYNKAEEVEVTSVGSSSSISSGYRSTSEDDEKAICNTAWKRLPIPMKSPHGVFLDNTLFVGGGFTMSSKTDAAIYSFNESSNSWVLLPSIPRTLKSSSLTTIGNKLVLLGGKQSQPSPGRVFMWDFSSTNQVVAWDVESQSWDFSLPPMIAPRVSPVVVKHNNYIIAAGGSKGSLDYRAELLDTSATPLGWVRSSNLPVPCYRNTSAVVGGIWYLLDLIRGDIFYIQVDAYVKQALHLKVSAHSDVASVGASNWQKLIHTLAVVPFKIANLGSQLIAFTDVNGKLSMHMLQDDETWSVLRGKQLPPSLASGLVLNFDAAPEEALLVLGGENAIGYSDKTYKLSLTTHSELRESKRNQRVTMWPTLTPGTVCV